MLYSNLISDPEVLLRWSKAVQMVATWNCRLFRPGLISKDGSSMSHLHMDLKQGPGSRLRLLLSHGFGGPMVMGEDELLSGTEQRMKVEYHDFYIDEFLRGTGLQGYMSQQNVDFDVLQESTKRLGSSFAQFYEIAGLAHLAGVFFPASEHWKDQQGYRIDPSDPRWTAKNTPTAPDSQHIFRAAALTDDADITSDHPLTIADIEDGVQIAKELPMPLRPIPVEGSDGYLILWHSPAQGKQLRDENSQWYALCVAALQGGLIRDNPLFTGASFLYDRVIGMETTYLPPAQSEAGVAVADTGRAVLCGQQALALGMGQIQEGWGTYRTFTYDEDAGRRKMVAAQACVGITAPRYKEHEQRGTTVRDLGKIVIPRYSKRKVS